MVQYLQDYDRVFPPTVVAGLGAPSYTTYPYKSPGPPVGWADALLPYLRDVSPYHCPSGFSSPTYTPSKSGYIDYWYNANLSGVRQRDLRVQSATLMVGEGG